MKNATARLNLKGAANAIKAAKAMTQVEIEDDEVPISDDVGIDRRLSSADVQMQLYEQLLAQADEVLAEENDGIGRIDYVLTYDIPEQGKTRTGQPKDVTPQQKKEEQRKRLYRDMFLAIARAKGAIITEEVSQDNDEVFVLVRLPMAPLISEAEEAQLSVNLKPPQNWDQPYEYDFTTEFSANGLKTSSFQGSNAALEEFFRQSQRSVLTKNFLLKIEFMEPSDWDIDSALKVKMREKAAEKGISVGGDNDKTDEELLKERKEKEGNRKEIGINTLLKQKAFTGWFPLHNEKKLNELRDNWSGPSNIYKSQPIPMIRKYFGEKIGLYFAWLGHYTTWLMAPTIAGIITWLVGLIEIKGANNSLTIPFSVFVGLWSTIYLEYWKRRQSELAFKWNVQNFEETEQNRPEFVGELEPSPVTGELEMVYPEYKRYGKYTAGAVSICIMLAVVIIAVIGIMIYRLWVKAQDPDPFLPATAGILNAFTINILNFGYGKLAVALTDWENHRTQTQYEDQLIVKTFLFQFINSYSSLAYISFFKPNANLFGLEDYCANNDCLSETSSQLGGILVTRMVVGNLQEVLVPIIMGKIALWKEQKDMTEEEKQKAAEKLNGLAQWEREAKLKTYASTFSDYNELIIQFGYVTLFVVAFPLAPLLAVANNLIEIRSDAYKLCNAYRRPAPDMAEDIGSWYGILEVVSIAAVLSNSLIISFTSTILANVETMWKYWIVAILEHGILIIKYFLAEIIPDVPEEVLLQMERAKYQRQLAVEKISNEMEAANPGFDQTEKHNNQLLQNEYKFDVDEDIENFVLIPEFRKLWEGRKAEIEAAYPKEVGYYDKKDLIRGATYLEANYRPPAGYESILE
eukprot:TRINITY_DN1669_c0_g1_i2.p1 TRINITY_DN1669_c0_g1~~TRINITY_DN1669_c0_g1_i2.p1  ORF type:complete len:879 (-),score=317.84 TRINITY_DN1669_c0_g1_i2:30-2609(-)